MFFIFLLSAASCFIHSCSCSERASGTRNVREGEIPLNPKIMVDIRPLKDKKRGNNQRDTRAREESDSLFVSILSRFRHEIFVIFVSFMRREDVAKVRKVLKINPL